VFSVAIGADRRFDYAALECFAVDAGTELLRDFGVAHTAALRDGLAELRRVCAGDFMSSGVAGGAIGRAFPLFQLEAVNAARMVGGDLLVALGAGRHGGLAGMWVGFSIGMAAGATDLLVSGCSQLTALIMA
jgi:hypothetical protein